MAEKETSEPIMQEMMERFAESEDGSSFNREDYENDVRFARLSEQWPEDVAKLRRAENRPCLTINRLPAFIRQVVNDARQNKPAIQVHPVDNGADVKTAEIINGIVRSIERHSNADVAYDTAIDHAVSGGFGFFTIGIDYAHEDTFAMEAKIHRVPNPLMVHWDVSSSLFDASDWDYAFVSEFLNEDEFEGRFPKASKVSFEGSESGDIEQHWLQEDSIRVAQYWLREEKTRKILQLSSGAVIREDTLTDEIKALLAVQGIEITREREAKFHKVTRRLVSGAEVLEEDEWPGSTIPVCPVWGEEIVLNGRRHFRSMVRDAKDPQTMFNYWRTASTELVALAPKAPFIGEEGFVPKGHEAKWQSANTRSHAYLEYTRGMNQPQRQPFAGVPAGAIQEALNASDDMKAIIGIYDSSLGARSNETSGRAILARQREADVSNFHFIDNLSRAIAYAGKVLVEIIPHVYSERETVRILGEDMTESVARLVTSPETAAKPNAEGEVEEALYDLSVGKYDVTVKAGPSYATQREETREALIEIMRAVPGAAQFIGDIVMEHMDFQGADKVAARLKMLLPPNIQQAEGIAAPQAMPGQPMPNMAMGVAPQNPGARAAQPMPLAPQGQRFPAQ